MTLGKAQKRREPGNDVLVLWAVGGKPGLQEQK